VRALFTRRLVLLMLLALTASGCQTIDDEGTTNTWNASPIARRGDEAPRRSSSGGTALLGNEPAGKSTVIEGTGRFIGEPSASDRFSAPEDRSAPEGGTDNVTLNLVNVPAPQAAKTVLGDILAVRYTVDPGIEGKITIQTPKPVAKPEVIDLFQSALRANGAAIVNANGMYRIVPIDQAPVGATIQIGNRPETQNRLGTGLRVVQLKYISAAEARRVLEPIVPHGSIVRTDEARNLITLSGSGQEIAGALDTIALFDVDVMKGMSFAIIPVATSQPDTIANELRNVFASDHEGPMAGMVRFIPNQRLKAILVISPQRAYLARAETWIRKFDAQAEGSEKQFFTYSVQNRRAQELVDVLQSMFSKETGAARTARNVSPQYREASVQPSGGQGGAGQSIGGASSAFPSSGAASTGLIQASASSAQGGAGPPPLSNGGSAAATSGQDRSAQGSGDTSDEEPRVKIVADDAKNAILIEATQADYKRVMRVIENLDVMPNQVLIEATIAEVTLNDELKFGLRWFLNGKSSTTSFTDDPAGAISSVFPGFSYALTAANITATLNALNTITDVNIVSSPTLTVMDNKTATLQIGDEVPITTQSAVSVLTTGAPVVNSVTYKDTGVILSITPRINESGRVLLDIEQEVSSVASTTSSGIDSPTIHQRRIKTSVTVNNGEGLALGGMIQDSKTVSHTQVPIVGDIPVIGNAFKSKDNTMVKTELIVIITPHVIRNLTEARAVTDEFRRQMSIYAPRDYHQPRTFEQSVRRTFE
jgi:general secretion pathway protein D